MTDYPNDADGDALKRIMASGSDMSKPMCIDFHVAMPDLESAKQCAERARCLGYHVEIYQSEEASPDDETPITVNCKTRMLATYEGVIAIQDELWDVSKDLGGEPDGWGSFGNVDD